MKLLLTLLVPSVLALVIICVAEYGQRKSDKPNLE
jgi:hypothetical protein